MVQTVLIACATGLLGSRIAHHLTTDPGAKVRLLVRSAADEAKQAALSPLIAAGADIAEGDLAQPDTLERATEGVDVVISAVAGDRSVMVDGQVALALAARRGGVRRIIPSDYALDLFKATPGEHAAFDARREADEAIAELGLEHIHILQGGFIDFMGPGSPLVDYEKGTAAYWGTGDEQFEVTTIDDTARVTARVALDRDVPNGKFAFCGDRISLNGGLDIVERLSGRRFARQSYGSEADLRKAMETADPQSRVFYAYQLYMMNGQTALDDLQNGRYPNISLTRFEDFMRGVFA
ncbi:NmrA family NAD(P)-binding protein [Sphingopyxis sp. 550A]